MDCNPTRDYSSTHFQGRKAGLAYHLSGFWTSEQPRDPCTIHLLLHDQVPEAHTDPSQTGQKASWTGFWPGRRGRLEITHGRPEASAHWHHPGDTGRRCLMTHSQGLFVGLPKDILSHQCTQGPPIWLTHLRKMLRIQSKLLWEYSAHGWGALNSLRHTLLYK